MADSSLSLRRAWAACLSARGRESALPLLKLNVPSDCFFTIRTKPRLLDPVFRPFQIQFKAETNPVSTVQRSFLCSPQLNCILTPVPGAAEPRGRGPQGGVFAAHLARPRGPAHARACFPHSSPRYSPARVRAGRLHLFRILFSLVHSLKRFICHVGRRLAGGPPSATCTSRAPDESPLPVREARRGVSNVTHPRPSPPTAERKDTGCRLDSSCRKVVWN